MRGTVSSPQRIIQFHHHTISTTFHSFPKIVNAEPSAPVSTQLALSAAIVDMVGPTTHDFRTHSHPPASAHPPWLAVVQLVSLVVAVGLINSTIEKHKFGVLAVLGSCLPMALIEVFINRVHLRPSTGLNFAQGPRPSLSRTGVKLMGLLCSLSIVAVLYWWFPQFRTKHYLTTLDALWWATPILLPSAVAYVYFVDARMVHPQDGLYLVGAIALRQVHLSQLSVDDKRELLNHATSYIIKLYYAPLMFGMFAGNMLKARTASYTTMLSEPKVFAARITTAVTAIDLLAAVSGYWCGFRLLDSHIRSTNPFFYGWFVTIIMYDPFWALVTQKFLPYGNRDDWHTVLPQFFPGHTWLLWVWAVALVSCKLSWAWANILYGFRFSNLTNRGVITAGPYRWTKHASYVSKNLSWWISGVPFLPAQGASTALRESLSLFGAAVFYYLRAMAEERHLSRDEDYVRYALWVEQHSPLRFLSAWAPGIFRYEPPADMLPIQSKLEGC